MGISYIKTVSPDAVLGLWHISEPWQELKTMLDLPAQELAPLKEKKTDRRKQEWLACRALLQQMTGSQPIINYDINRKPHIKNTDQQISMSHSGEYACVYLHKTRPVGVDIQQMKPSISKGCDYFLNEDEKRWVTIENNVQLHLIWSAKESAFKYAGDMDMDLKKHIITNAFNSNQNSVIQVSILKGNMTENILVQSETFDDYVLTWTI
ncbi:4'-phosphopantetheinyl transferase family protein [Dyadobacter pollutisoli]|uniref:4'-phosphopantetheinyl transferase superfamily protein n=1 Tax=Dyadobacter pollutisoli TaxID=2910158 RepID=A0A9E8NBG4_9BACT|nr:4'-phosphopantetheinyl transferase superfamily protein [Dyadobacter pollutisoli]WAC12893.1 4'-phosphopantetheinyl transferase superfamily protein [Dyadobacter pollutisoli]